MKPEIILQSSLLDILFENRNKDYGAYELRKEYNYRLGKALAITALIALLIVVSQYIQANYFKNKISDIAGLPITEVKLQAPPVNEPKEEPREQKIEKLKPISTKAYAPPLIVPDNKADKDVPTMDELAKSLVGVDNTDGGDAVPGEVVQEEKTGDGIADVVAPAKVEAPEVKGPLVFAEVMPEFPGGMEAFRKFLMKNLREPDNLAAGETAVVKVRFVVGADGSIQDVNVYQSGGELDKEVLRAISRMPRWKPGVQNGRNVAVYFSLPVTFLGATE